MSKWVHFAQRPGKFCGKVRTSLKHEISHGEKFHHKVAPSCTASSPVCICSLHHQSQWQLHATGLVSLDEGPNSQAQSRFLAFCIHRN